MFYVVERIFDIVATVGGCRWESAEGRRKKGNLNFPQAQLEGEGKKLIRKLFNSNSYFSFVRCVPPRSHARNTNQEGKWLRSEDIKKEEARSPVGIHVESPAITCRPMTSSENLSRRSAESRAKLIFISKTISSGVIMRMLGTTCKLMR
jgi:hypothetical protein